MSFILLIVVLVVLGFAAWAIETAPFLDSTFKAAIKWLLIVLAGVFVLVYVLALIGQGPVLSFHW